MADVASTCFARFAGVDSFVCAETVDEGEEEEVGGGCTWSIDARLPFVFLPLPLAKGEGCDMTAVWNQDVCLGG